MITTIKRRSGSLRVIELDKWPMKWKNFVVYPEYHIREEQLFSFMQELKPDTINVVGMGKSNDGFTKVAVCSNKDVYGYRTKISIFTGEDSKVSPILNAIDVAPNIRLGVVICREVLHTAIAEVYRMMGVNIIAVTISGGQFWDLQRQSWIDQMILFSDIVGGPLLCSSGATKRDGGLNLVVIPEHCEE